MEIMMIQVYNFFFFVPLIINYILLFGLIGFGTVGSMDVLSATGFVNYFGKWTDLTHVVVSPIILKKRNTHVALYGLSYINDQRLSRLYRDDKVHSIQVYFSIWS